MNRITDMVKDGRVLVSDGAWGTQLQLRGLKPGKCPEQWNADHRNVVAEIAADYVAAGPDMIKTNSFGGSSFKLALFGLEAEVADLNRLAAEISRKAAGATRHVLGSVGPTGKMLLMGDVTQDDMYEAFREQVTALEAGGADVCCVETMSDLEEAAVAIRAAHDHTQLEIACSFTFERTTQGDYRTMMGVSPEDAARAGVDAGADIIGSNCGNGIANMVEIVGRMRQVAPHTPILVHANAGMPRNVDGVDVFPEGPDEMADQVRNVVRAGANIVGGCCGTTPDHVRAIAAVVNEINRRTR